LQTSKEGVFQANLWNREAMDLTLSIPDDLAGRLGGSGGDLSRRALEAFAVEEYKKERISKAEVRRLLGIQSRYDLDGFLKAHGVWIEYGLDDFQREQEALDRLGV
jgi:predicted HTH domain antitoxin